MSTRSEIPIPEFFIAFVFPDEYTHYTYRDPTADETEELRQQTVKFWTEQLDQVYNDDTKGGKGLCTFEKIDLKIKKTVFGPRTFLKDRRDDLDNRFNTYLELSGKATFLVSSSTKKKPSIPTGNDIFRKMVAGDSMDYLCKYVKSQSTDDEKKNDDNENIYTKAIEVCAKRLQEDPDNQVFVVRSPTFFVALATDPLDEEEAREPTKTETYNLTKRTKDHIQKHIKEDYPNTFMNCHMSLVKTEIGTDKPDDRFKLYYEHEVVATFTADPPTPTELFALIMRISSIGFPEYVTTLRAMDQTPYVAVTMITVQIVGLEMQEAIELEELPPPQEEEEEDKSLGSGDEEEQEDEKSEASTPPPQPLKELTTRNVPIFLALVVWTEPPAAMPTRADLQQFEDLMLRYFYTVLKNEYREILHDMKLERKETRFDAGIPEPRFNVCVEYDATIRFDCDDETAPDNKTLKKIILHVNISTILAHVRKLEPLCFEKCSEVSMRKKPKKQKAEKKKIKDSAFEAAVDLLEPPPIDYEAEKKAEEEAAAKAAEAEKKAKEKAAAKEAARKKAAAKKKALEEQAARVRAEAEAKKKAEEEKIAAEKAAAEAKAAEEAKKKAKEEAAKRAKEEAKRKAEEEAAKKKAEEEAAKKKAEEEAAKKKAEEEAAAAKAAEEAAQKKKKKKPKKEKKAAVDKEPVPPGKRAHTAEVYTAFKLRNCEVDPSDEDYEKLREKTQKFFTKRLTKEFGSKLSAVRIKIHEKAFGSERPDKTFNVYVEWDIETFYISDDGSQELSVELDRRESIIVDGEDGNAPSPEKLIRVLVRDTDVMGYLIKAVQPLKNTPFANVSMGFFGAKVKTTTTY